MKLSGSYQINLSKEKVWEALNDPEILKKAIPGCEEFTKNSETEFTAKATNKIGPFNASFTGDVWEAAFHRDHHRFFHLVADDGADPFLDCHGYGVGDQEAVERWRSDCTVSSWASLMRTSLKRCVLASWRVACSKRSWNSSRRRPSICSLMSESDRLRTSAALGRAMVRTPR